VGGRLNRGNVDAGYFGSYALITGAASSVAGSSVAVAATVAARYMALRTFRSRRGRGPPTGDLWLRPLAPSKVKGRPCPLGGRSARNPLLV
jgi:hypothetical protein